MSGPLSGKTALVTGSSKGIGRATALALAAQGANVVINYQSSSAEASEVVHTIGDERAVAIQADVSDLASSKQLIDKTVERFGKIDILALNAGLLKQNGSLDDTDEKAFDTLFKINVKAPFFMTKEAVPHIPSGGRIIFFSTSLTAASTATPNYLLYVSTKGAIEQMSRILAKDLGRKGINVNVISPGPTGTDAFYEGKNEGIVKTIASGNPFNRVGTTEEIANAVTFLAGPQASWVSGQNLRVNGAMTIG